MRPLSPTSEDVVSVGPHSSLLSLFLSLSLSLSLSLFLPPRKKKRMFSRGLNSTKCNFATVITNKCYVLYCHTCDSIHIMHCSYMTKSKKRTPLNRFLDRQY
jgi:hypothetical protein